MASMYDNASTPCLAGSPGVDSRFAFGIVRIASLRPKVVDAAVKTSSLEALLRRTQLRREAFLERPFFAVVRSEELDDEAKRRVFLACVRRFSINFQTLLFSRQALCTDPRYYTPFLKHLNEEIGHDQLLEQGGMPSPIDDTLFEAILGWFNFQMVALDNADKAALMHLVLEAAGDCIHRVIAARLRGQVDSPYFEEHSELDESHAMMGEEMLGGLEPATYARLALVVERGWNMMEAITDRVCQLLTET